MPQKDATTMKKTAKIALLALVLAATVPAKAFNFEYNGLKFKTKSDNTCEVTKSSASGDVVIPEEAVYDGTKYTVVAIGDGAFTSSMSMTSVTIPNTVKSIGTNAFTYCYLLKSLTIPNSVTSIGAKAFSLCSKLETVELSNSLVTIGDNAFSGCKKLATIEIPNSVTTIGAYAFSYCYELASVTLSNSLTTIGAYAFNQCYGLKSIEIPSSVTTIRDYAFMDCHGLTSIYLSRSLTSIGANIFANCSALETLVLDPENEMYDSRDNCNAIVETATNKLVIGCKNSTIPNTITAIGSSAFSGCSGLSAIEIPNSVTSIGNSAFSFCTDLTAIDIPSTVTYIGSSAFSDSGLKSITIPDGITTIGFGMFAYCSRLASVTLPSSLISIEIKAFDHCTSLASIDIPASVKSIGSSAFYGSGLTSIDINNVTEIGDMAFEYCAEMKSASILKAKSVPESTFENCIALEKLVLPYEWTSDFKMDFSTLCALNTLYIGEKTATIPDGAFHKNLNLYNFYSNAPTPPASGDIITGWVDLQGTLYVPKGCLDAYKKVSEYSCGFRSFQELPYQVVVADEDVSVDISKSTTVSASVTPADATTAPVRWYSLDDDIATVTTDGVVTGVAEGEATLVALCDGITATLKVDVKNSNAVKDVTVDSPEEDGTFDVYNLQGIRVASGIDKAELASGRIAPGIYILVTPRGCKKVRL